MSSVKVKFRPSSVKGKEGMLYYQVIHKSVVKQVRTTYSLYPEEWNNRSSLIVFPVGATEGRCTYLSSIQKRIIEDISRIQRNIRHFEGLGVQDVAESVVRQFLSPYDNSLFLSFGRQLVRELRLVGRRQTAETYNNSLNSFEHFRGAYGDVSLGDVNEALMVSYEQWLKGRGVCPNTISYYMRNLRAIYNRAVDKVLTEQRNPFKRVYTGIDKTVKRAVSLNSIRKIRDMDLGQSPSMDFARDIFMFSFYTRGMAFVDIAYLKKKDLHNGVLTYRRRKTNQQLFIKWEQPMQQIVDKYDTSETPFLLPIIGDVSKDKRIQYRNAEHRVNIHLKRIGRMLGLSVPLTTYVARHGWASIAKSKNIPVATISEAMGHDSEKTTRIYLASLDMSVVDRANRRILNSL